MKPELLQSGFGERQRFVAIDSAGRTAMSVTAMIEQYREISEVMAEQRPRLRSFIRKRVPNEADVEDLLQEVFYELVRARRLLMPVDYVTGWLFSVARNRITDLFRKKKPDNFGDLALEGEDGDFLDLGELLPSPEDGPEALYARKVILDRLEAALAQLPVEQRDVFIAHELEGRSFKELAAETGISISTLLSRKRYAVHFLRRRLKGVHDELMGK
jgi:RNA polymerase sigma factor (sigma-70 family)